MPAGARDASAVAAGHPRRLAYADPPYPGKSARYYSDHADYGGEVDHAELVSRLSAEFDAWALSTSATALRDVLALCPPGVRVAAWFRGPRPHATAATPVNAWEPVIYAGQISRRVERPLDASPVDGRRVDALVKGPAPRRTDPRRVIGAKPPEFCRWVFDLLAAQPGDEFVDLFPGSGGVSRAWRVFEASRPPGNDPSRDAGMEAS